MPKLIKQITALQVEQIAKSLAKKKSLYNQLIIGFTQRNRDVLESCLKAPFQKINNKEQYPTLEQQAGVLFYMLVKEQPFAVGNNRMAMAVLFYFMALNGQWVSVDKDTLRQTLQWVIDSPGDAKEEVIQYLSRFLAKNMKSGMDEKK